MYTTNFFEDDIFGFVDVDEDNNNNNQSERIFELDDPPVVERGEDLILFCCCGKKGTFTKKNTLIYNNFSDDDNDNDNNIINKNKNKNKRKREIIGSDKMTFSEIRCQECDLVLTLSSHPVMKWCIDSVSLEKMEMGISLIKPPREYPSEVYAQALSTIIYCCHKNSGPLLNHCDDRLVWVKMHLKNLLYCQKMKEYETKMNENNKLIHRFFHEFNRCVVCFCNIGPDNPRQLCGKTKCDLIF
jgi:hypothetical protein